MKNCAIYTRVSTSMQAEKDYNSCDAQKDKILAYIKSQEDLVLFKEYSDPGFSGGNVERPGLNELLGDIAQGKVHAVLTYKIDRLTRSSKDFYSLIEYFDKYGVSFVSVTERFDTSSPAGRLLRNIMLTFAQFEREMIVERTKDKMLQRAEKGLWNGGGVPLGYKREDGKLLIDKEKAKLVREIFETYALTGSIARTLEFVREKDVRTGRKNLPMPISTLWNILRNQRYIGNMLYGGNLYKAQHEPIISDELFEKAKSLWKKKIVKKRLYREFPLASLVTCVECGSNMTPCFTSKAPRRYFYYKCYSVVREGAKACGIKEINADKLEAFIIENLSRIAQDKQYIESLAFKIAYETPRQAGFELPTVWPQNLATRVSQVLINFKNKIQNATQVERCLIFERLIEKINFSRHELEVIINIKDTYDVMLGKVAGGQSGKSSAGMRAGAANLTTPACTTGSLVKNGVSDGI